MAAEITVMTIHDYEEVIGLWRGSSGIGLSSADSPEGIAAYLERNPGSSFVARVDGKLVGAVICGHDGRRGLLHHLAVHPSHRRQGVGRQLALACLRALEEQGIDKCHIFVYHDNYKAQAFWKELGWVERTELVLMSANLPLR